MWQTRTHARQTPGQPRRGSRGRESERQHAHWCYADCLPSPFHRRLAGCFTPATCTLPAMRAMAGDQQRCLLALIDCRLCREDEWPLNARAQHTGTGNRLCAHGWVPAHPQPHTDGVHHTSTTQTKNRSRNGHPFRLATRPWRAAAPYHASCTSLAPRRPTPGPPQQRRRDAHGCRCGSGTCTKDTRTRSPTLPCPCGASA